MKRLILSLLFLSSLGALSQGDALLAQNHPNVSFASGAQQRAIGHASPTSMGTNVHRPLDNAERAQIRMRTVQALQRQRAAQVHALLDNLEIGAVKNDSLFAGEGVPHIQIRNLELNSRYSDFAPMFHRGTQLVFASSRDTGTLSKRRYKRNKQPFLDLYVADAQGEGAQAPRKFSQVLNTKYHEASVAFSKDEKTVYFTRNNFGKRLKRRKDRDVAHLKIFRSTLVNGEWTPGEELSINGEGFSTGHPALGPDGKQLYFVSDRPGGYGGTDLYVADILPNGGFSEPRNLGRTVNTDAKEMFPYITEDALYFSSDRAMGLGGLDVYRAGHSGGLFSVGVNLGAPINSKGDDFSFIVDASGHRGFFASNRKGGKGDDDIYAFDRTFNLNGIGGTVTEAENGQPLEQAKVVLLDRKEKLLDRTLTRADGSFVFKDLEPLTPYTLQVAKDGFLETTIETATQANRPVRVDPQLEKEPLPMDDVKKQLVLDPEAIRFNFDRYDIRPEAAQELDKLVALLLGNPNLVIKIEAHTDAVGDSGYNLYLSDKRAKSTRDYLISQGVDGSQIESAIGYGESRPLNECSEGTRCTKEQHRVNRRSEFHIVSQ